jgi:hypothetical protein
MIILGKEEISVIMVALVSPMVMVSIMAVGIAIVNLATKDATLVMLRDYVKFGSYSNKFSHFGPLSGRKLEAETLALMVLDANILENQEIKVAMVALEIAGEESQKRKREATFYYRFMSSAYEGSSSRTQLLEETHGVVCYLFVII